MSSWRRRLSRRAEDAKFRRIMRRAGLNLIRKRGGKGVVIAFDQFQHVNPDPVDLEILEHAANGEGVSLLTGEPASASKHRRQWTARRRRRRLSETQRVMQGMRLEDLANTGDTTYRFFYERAEAVMERSPRSVNMATTVRRIRVDEKRSWRGVARGFVAAFPHIRWIKPVHNQLAGMALCRAAAEKLGEDWRRPPWNG